MDFFFLKYLEIFATGTNGCHTVHQKCYEFLQIKHIGKHQSRLKGIPSWKINNISTFQLFTERTVPSHDFWQFGIVLFVCLTGCLPWQKAAPDDPRYVRYVVWQNSSLVIPIKRTPKLFKLLTSRACKLFRKFLEPNPDRRPKNLSDLQKFVDDRWLAKNAEKDMIGTVYFGLPFHCRALAVAESTFHVLYSYDWQ